MKRYGNLFPQVISFRNILLASHKAFRGKKLKKNAASFYFGLENEAIQLQTELTTGIYLPRGYQMFEIREPKVRQICSSNFRDRVVHHAICNVLEPLFEARMIGDTYACRKGRGTHVAVKRCQQFTRKYKYFLKCDIKKYFQSIDHEIMKNILAKFIKDKPLLRLVDRVIDHAVPGNPPGKGLPIGNLTSQHFANLYLGELDHFIKDRLGIKGYLRYMDDFISFSDDKQSLHELLSNIQKFLKEHLQLELKETATRIAPISEGVPFLGLRVFPNLKRLQRPNLLRFRRKMRRRELAFQEGKIDELVFLLSVNSMVAHVSQADSLELRRKELERSIFLA